MARTLPVRPGHTGRRSAAVNRVLGPCGGGTPPSPGSPTVSSVTPSTGNVAGGTTVTISGTNFAAGAAVSFGAQPGTNVVVTSATSLTVTTPAAAAGAVTVTVTVSGQSGSLANGFTFTTTPSGGAITYPTLLTDRNIRQSQPQYGGPPLHVMGPAGDRFQDPTFGTWITRITDQNTLPGGAWITVDGASFRNNWSSDGAYFTADNRLFTRAGQHLRSIVDQHGGQLMPWFAHQEPNIIYGNGGTDSGFGMLRYDFIAGQYQLMFDFGVNFPSTPSYPTGIVVSDYTDTRFACYFDGGSQDEFRKMVVYDRSLNQYKVLDLDGAGTGISSVGGWFNAGTPPTPSAMHPLIDQNGWQFWMPNLPPGTSDGWHSVEIDRTGRYLWMGINCWMVTNALDQQSNTIQDGFGGNIIWDLETDQMFRWHGGGSINTNCAPPSGGCKPLNTGFAAKPAGHSCTGFGNVVNIGGSDDTAISAWLRPLQFDLIGGGTGNAAVPSMTQLVNPPANQTQGNQDGHLGWSSATPTNRNPIYWSRYLGGDAFFPSPSAVPANQLWDQELILVDPDTFVVYRICHHHAWYTGSFWSAPHGNISRQGDRVIFGSNWENTLAGGRYDIFMVELPLG